VQEIAKKFEREKKGLSGWDKTAEDFRNEMTGLKGFAYAIAGPAGGLVLAFNLFKKMLERTNAGISPKQATKEIIAETQTGLHPEKTQYEVGSVITNEKSGKSYKVIGFFPDGEPDVDEIK